jgi:hypothetical protein
MATSLGQAYSILGSAQGAEFKRRRDEERDYYATQERKARQNMLLGYLVKPIGEQIGAGISDIISTPFRDPVKKLLDSEQARTFKSDISKLNKQKAALAGIQKQITDKHSGDANSYAFEKITADKTREVFAAYKAQYSGLTDEAIRDSKTDIGNAYRKDLSAALRDVNKEAEDYATSLNKAFTAVGSMSTSKEISDTLERVTPYSKGIVSKVWNMGSSLFRGEPMLGGPSKARMEESFLKAREILDFTTEEVETLSGILKAGASSRTFEDTLLTKALGDDIKQRTEYFDFLENSSLPEDVANGKYGNNFNKTYYSLVTKEGNPSSREVRNEMAKQFGVDNAVSGDDVTNIKDRIAVTNPKMTATRDKYLVDVYNSTAVKKVTDIQALTSQTTVPPEFKKALAQWDLVNRVAVTKAAESVFNEYDRLSPKDASEFLAKTSKEAQIQSIEDRAVFIINNSLEKKTETTDNWVMPNVTTDKYTGFLVWDKEAFNASLPNQPVATTTTPPSTTTELLPFSSVADTLKAQYLEDPDAFFPKVVATMRKDNKIDVPDEDTLLLMVREWRLETNETPSIPASTVKREVGAAAIPQVLSTLRDLLPPQMTPEWQAEKAAQRATRLENAPPFSIASLGQTPLEYLDQRPGVFPRVEKLAEVTGTPPSMTATTDRAGQQQLLEDITPKNTQTTSEPVPKASGRSLLEVPVETKTELPIVTTTDRKAKPVSKQVAAAFRGTDAPAVDKVRDYLDTTETEITESILSDLAAASKYDPDVIELLRDSYNYEPKDLTLPRYPQFNPSGSVEDKVKFMTSLDTGRANDFIIDVQASKVMSEDDLNTMIEKYLDILKQGNS